MHNKVHEAYAQEEVRKMIPRSHQELKKLYERTKEPRSSPTVMVAKVEEWQNQLQQVQ